MKKLIILFVLLISTSAFFLMTSFEKRYVPTDNCEGVSQENRAICLKEEFDEILTKFGIHAGFDLLTFLYQKDINFPSSCHDYTHLIGEEAYKRFSKGEKFKLTSATSYCGYGFYHGFILSLFEDGKGRQEAANFCSFANDTLSSQTSTTILDCYHGIGHGMIDFNLSESFSLDLGQKVVDTSLKLCKDASKNEEQVGRCFNGIYHSVLDLVSQNGSDVFDFCRLQSNENLEQCFSASSSFVMRDNNDDFAKSTLITQDELEEKFARIVIRSMAGYEGYRSVGNEEAMKKDIKICQMLTKTLKEECIRGLVEGLTDFGMPGAEEKEIKIFCQDGEFNEEESNFCFNHALDYFGRYFGEVKKQKLENLINNK